jgi:RNA polymerase sigma-70 factor (ECF subfamily)
MNRELSAGIRQHLVSTSASHDLTIWNMTITNPPENPLHCPPGVTWLISLRRGRAHRMQLFHAKREQFPSGDDMPQPISDHPSTGR